MMIRSQNLAQSFFSTLLSTILIGQLFLLPVAQASSSTALPAPAAPPQFVMFAFDGSLNLDRWDSTLKFAHEMKQKDIQLGKPKNEQFVSNYF